jgi:DNA polymerase-3 subunit alpha
MTVPASQTPFAHLHVHTEYSMLDGAARLKDLIAEVKSQGMTHVAMTDHGNMFAAAEFHRQAIEAGIADQHQPRPVGPAPSEER